MKNVKSQPPVQPSWPQRHRKIKPSKAYKFLSSQRKLNWPDSMNSEKIFNKEKVRELLSMSLVIIVAGIVHFTLVRNMVSEIVLYLVFGLTGAELYYGNVISDEYRERFRTYLFAVVFLAWITAVIFDPILKPYLDMILNANTVPTYSKSLVSNTLILSYFLEGYGLRYLVGKVKCL